MEDNQAGEIQPTPGSASGNEGSVQADVNPWDQMNKDEYSPDPRGMDSSTIPADDQQNLNQDGSQSDGAPPAVALNSDTASQTPASPGPVPYERFKEVTDKARTYEAEVSNIRRMAEFYQQQYNELVAQNQGRPTAPNGPPAQRQQVAPDQLPAGIKPPEEWDTQADMAAYIDHAATRRAETLTQTKLEQAYNQTIVPQMQMIHKVMATLDEALVKVQHPDFEEVTHAVIGDMFVLDHEGKVWTDPSGAPKIKNPALVNWLRQNPRPKEALYNYALSKQAPQKIAESVKTNTRQLLESIDTRPKGPTSPRQGGSNAGTPDLGWDTPRAVVDKILSQKGLV